MHHRVFRLILMTCLVVAFAPARPQSKPFLSIGIFLGRIEEGARIFTPVRLLPFTHPESQGHQFPNATQLYGTEFEDLLWLGRLAGYQLWSTLNRYPTEPSPTWPYPGFAQLPDTSTLRTLPCVRRPMSDVPLKGLRAVVFVGREPVGFIVDTRNLTLAERGMSRASTMGLDITRADFLVALGKARGHLGSAESGAVIFGE